MIYIYAQKRYLPKLGPCKMLRKGIGIMQLSIYRTIESIVRRIWANPDTVILAIDHGWVIRKSAEDDGKQWAEGVCP
jgi:hypothetical protein